MGTTEGDTTGRNWTELRMSMLIFSHSRPTEKITFKESEVSVVLEGLKNKLMKKPWAWDSHKTIYYSSFTCNVIKAEPLFNYVLQCVTIYSLFHIRKDLLSLQSPHVLFSPCRILGSYIQRVSVIKGIPASAVLLYAEISSFHSPHLTFHSFTKTILFQLFPHVE